MAADEILLKALGVLAALALAIMVPAALSGDQGTAERAEPATNRPEPPPYTLTLSPGQSRIDLQGRIDFGITAELSALLEDAPGVRTLRLQSPGGRVAEARGLVTLVKRFALATTARGDCASACTLVFIAGHSRELAPGARLGFHAYAQHSQMFGLIDPAAEQARDSALFAEAGVDAEFIDRAMATPHRAMWFPGRRALIDAGVIDQP
ncbi:MAG: hypothetical protein JJT95_07830 [Pararhodobacter sp.]|nr:hypothetical protein [Pararhodobacter sp.]